MILCGAVLSALGYAVVIVKLTHKYNSFTIISWQNLLGWLFFLPLFFLVDFNHFKQASFSQAILLNLLYLAILGSSVAYIFFTYSIKKLGITTASLFTNLIPIFTAILAYYFLAEELTGFKYFGILIVIAGLFLGQLKFKNRDTT
jgi:drug/metabolite transporter (DMT)-like permease